MHYNTGTHKCFFQWLELLHSFLDLTVNSTRLGFLSNTWDNVSIVVSFMKVWVVLWYKWIVLLLKTIQRQTGEWTKHLCVDIGIYCQELIICNLDLLHLSNPWLHLNTARLLSSLEDYICPFGDGPHLFSSTYYWKYCMPHLKGLGN